MAPRESANPTRPDEQAGSGHHLAPRRVESGTAVSRPTSDKERRPRLLPARPGRSLHRGGSELRSRLRQSERLLAARDDQQSGTATRSETVPQDSSFGDREDRLDQGDAAVVSRRVSNRHGELEATRDELRLPRYCARCSWQRCLDSWFVIHRGGYITSFRSSVT